MIQLDPPLWLDTPKGRGLAHFLIDNGIEHDLQWTVFITDTRECWTFGNTDIRIAENFTIGRTPEGNYAEKLKTTMAVNLDVPAWGHGSTRRPEGRAMKRSRLNLIGRFFRWRF